MALADILSKIEGDALIEAEELVSQAERSAEETLAEARERAEREAAETIERGRRAAESEAETIRASARLAARDTALAARRDLIRETLERAAGAIAALPDERYTALFASHIATAARGGETVQVASADAKRLGGLEAAVRAAGGDGLGLVYSAEPADIEHGVVLLGTRARVDLSLAALLADREDELELRVSSVLFGDGKV